MKFSTIAIVAAIAASTTATANAELRGLKKSKSASDSSKSSKKMGKKSNSAKNMKMDLVASEEEEPEVKRILKATILSIEGVDGDIEFTADEQIWLEDLVLENLNKEAATDTSNGIREHHTVLFAGNKPGRKLSLKDGGVDVEIFDEFTCKYCPNEEEKYIPRTNPPTPGPTPAPTPAPTYDFGKIFKEAEVDKLVTNYCTGSHLSPFTRLRRIAMCHLS